MAMPFHSMKFPRPSRTEMVVREEGADTDAPGAETIGPIGSETTSAEEVISESAAAAVDNGETATTA